MSRFTSRLLVGLYFSSVSFVWMTGCGSPPPEEELSCDMVGSSVEPSGPPTAINIYYPYDETLFPPEIAAPTFGWQDDRREVDAWRIQFSFSDGGQSLAYTTQETQWKPADDDWEAIKQRSVESATAVTIEGYSVKKRDQQVLSTGSLTISTSQDEVGAPLFFREVNVPFRTAVKDPAAYIRWRFGPISSQGPPPIVLEKLPVCGNCHSFSADGRTLAMEVDSGNDKASYAIAAVQEEIELMPDNIITWADYRREDGEKTFGLLCQASPDGRYVIGTVKDRALAVYRDELAFSQLFFLVKGVLAVYDRQTKTFNSLPGADDIEHVQTNGTWSPDGETIIFSRSRDKAYDPPSLKHVDSVLVPQNEAEKFLSGGRKFQYDLYRIPFNGGQGGVAEPVEGASDNGMSNYFPKVSPDGKWIVFCKAKSFMLLQPDSELYIIPAAGGQARRLQCNLPRMNSWHSWSPNGKWLVFASKAHSVYTQLYLTHIDEQGNSSPAVLLEHFTEPQRAANIPEFVNASPDAIQRITENFLDDTNYLRAGDEYRKQGDFAGAIPLYRRALEINPDNAQVHTNWASCLLSLGQPDEAKIHLQQAVAIQPDLAIAHCNLGIVFKAQNDPEAARAAYQKAVQCDPELAAARLHFGTLLVGLGEWNEAVGQLKEAVRLTPSDPYTHYNLAIAYRMQEQFGKAAQQLSLTLEDDPQFIPAMVSLALIRATSPDTSQRDGQQAVSLATKACQLSGNQSPEALHALAAAYAETGQLMQAVKTAETAVQAALALGNPPLAQAMQESLQTYREQLKAHSE